MKSIIYCCLLLLFGCVEPYAPEVIEGPNNYLVVDGLINAKGITTLKLSRTQNISETQASPLEGGATLMLEEEQGAQYPLSEINIGTYVSNSLDLNLIQRYRLYIRLRTGEEYASDFVPVKQTPPIDQVGWLAQDEKVNIYVSTHDSQNDTRYYRWEYDATWAYTSAFAANIRYDQATGTIVPITDKNEGIYHCWRTESSTDIELGSSVKLNQDVIHEYPLVTLPAGTEELRIKYSILVKQYALTQEAYQYWETLMKNTESIGTLFDPLPSQLTGNVHRLADPDEPVIGYVGASSVQEARIFIDRKQLPQEWRTFYPTCQLDSLSPVGSQTLQDLAEQFQSGNYLPISEIFTPTGFPVVIGYTAAQKNCVDCRTRGTNVKPAYWE